MKILVFTRYSRLGASSRLRTYQFIPYLEQNGLDIEVSCLFDDEYLNRLYSSKRKSITHVAFAYLRRAIKLFYVKNYDVIWIEKELFPYLPAFAEWSLAKLGVKYIVDYDDAIFHYYDQHKLKLIRGLLGNKISSIMRQADCVIVGNNYLKRYAEEHGALCVKLLPTVVNLKRYEIRPDRPAKTGKVTVGWIGSPGSQHILLPFMSCFKEVYERFEVEFTFVGARSFGDVGFPIQYVPWTEETEVESILGFDIGIMPLMDTPWENGKCGYKLIQYQACGKPVVASPVGVNQLIVRHGETGYLAKGLIDWQIYLNKLIESEDLRRQMGRKGREVIEQRYELNLIAPQLRQIILGKEA